jgi:hypothetical protein
MAKKIPIMARYEKDADARYTFAKLLFDAQDDATQDVILRLVEKMQHMTGQNYVRIRAGKNETALPIPYDVQQKNFLWIALKMLVTLAEMDIQVANFTPPPNICAECGTSTTVRKKKRPSRVVS